LNELLLSLGLGWLKGLLTLLLLPPVPLLLAVLAGALRLRRHPRSGWLLVGAGLAGLWLCSTTGFAQAAKERLLDPPAALTAAGREALAAAAPDGHTAIVVLGGGRRALAPEYGEGSLNALSLERLRYGLWLGARTGLPVAFSGGVAPRAPDGASEAELAATTAAQEFGRPLRWAEDRSRDTRENARLTLALLQPDGVRRIVVVTHDFHMRRALRNFERAAAARGQTVELVAAPVGLPQPGPFTPGDWTPSAAGLQASWLVLREWLGWLSGA
jgi:uncharacterized SAM-binding protein YcdF (DUF218 family)